MSGGAANGEPGPRARKVRQLLWLLSMLLVAGAICMAGLTGFGLWYSAKPEFCISCHYMQPYYDSWSHSKHNKVTCGQCHYPPDVQSELVNHFRNLSQVAKYFTWTYGPRPWAEIEDASCLRSGCHEKRLLRGKVRFGTVSFDHRTHLTEMRRKKVLRCVSCHSQMVQGRHMSVTKSTCILCHFKETSDPRTTTCTICHDLTRLPARHDRPGLPGFDHKLVQQQGIDCRKCHGNAISGDGAVSRERCQECHAEQGRVNRIRDTEFMHLTHVTRKHITCMRCHAEIIHEVKTVEANFRAQCQSCHATPHKAERALYAGQGAAGLAAMPDAMYKVRVSCKGCHLVHKKLNANRTVELANEAACISCHNVGYANMLARWRGLQGQVQAMQAALAQARDAVGRGGGDGLAQHQARALLAKAAQNIELVSYGKAVHNPAFSARLLSTAGHQLDAARRAAGDRSVSSLPAAVANVQYLERGNCMPCHVQLPDDRQVFGLAFKHSRHLARGYTSCGMCHQLPAAGRPAKGNHGRLTMDRATCMTCHHGPAQQQVSCRTCHADLPAGRQVAGLRFEHERHVSRAGLACTTCHALGANGAPARVTVTIDQCMTCHHQQSVQRGLSCRSCHASPPDAPAFGMAFQHQRHLARGLACTTCHAASGANVRLAVGRADCLRCHHQQTVKAGATCAQCHPVPARAQQGQGVAGVKGSPSAMAALGCEICHTAAASGNKAVIKGTCKTCHQEGDYAAMVDGIAATTAATLQELGKLQAAYRLQRAQAVKQGRDVAAADQLAEQARSSMAFARSDPSGGVHNMGYVGAVLDQAKAWLEQATAKLKAR